MKKIFTSMMMAAGLFAATTVQAQEPIIINAEKVADITAALNDPTTKEGTLYKPGDVVYIKVKYSEAMYNLKTVYLPPCGNIHIIGESDPESGKCPTIGAEFVLNKKDNTGATIGILGNVEGDKFSLHFENLVLKDNNGAFSNSKHFINAKDTLMHYVDSLTFRNCEITDICRSFYRIEPQKKTDADGVQYAIEAGDLGYFEMSDCRFHWGSMQSNAMPLIYIPQPTTEMIFRNNTFYDLPYLNSIVAFAYMTDDTGRQKLDFVFENNTVSARSKSTLFVFATGSGTSVNQFVTSRSTFTIKNNIFATPYWADDANNRFGDSRDSYGNLTTKDENPDATNGILSEEEIADLKDIALLGLYEGKVDISNNFIYGYKEAAAITNEEGGELDGDNTNYLTRSTFDFDSADFNAWEEDNFNIAKEGDNLSAFYTAGTDGTPIGDVNNYTDEKLVFVSVTVKAEGSQSAEVVILDKSEVYQAGSTIRIYADKKGKLNTFKGWSTGETADTLYYVVPAEDSEVIATFEEIDYEAVWNFEQLTKNNMKFAAPLAPNYGDENVTLRYARWQEATEEVPATDESDAIPALPAGYYDKTTDAIETRNNKVAGDVRNCFFISTPQGVFNTEGQHADYAYIDIPAAKNGHCLQFAVATDNVPYKNYSVDYTVDGGTTWETIGSFEMTNNGEWFEQEFKLPATVDGKNAQVRIKGIEENGVFISESFQQQMEDTGAEITREFLFVTEVMLRLGSADGIVETKAASSKQAATFNLMGMKVAANTRGLLIKDGKKLIVK